MKIKSFIIHPKFVLKVFALIFSVFIWVYVYSSAEMETNVNIKFSLNYPTGFSPVTEVSEHITYRIKGPRVFVKKFMAKKYKMNIDLAAKMKNGKRRILLSMDQYRLKLPLGISLLETSPSIVEVKIEKTYSKLVPIRLQFALNTNKKIHFKNIELEKSKVRITGAHSVVDEIVDIDTEYFGDQARNQKFAKIGLVSPDARVKLSENFVNVSFLTELKVSEFTFSKIPIIFQSTKLIKKAFTKVVNVRVQGHIEKLKKLNPGQVHVLAIIPRSGQGNIAVKLVSELPTDIEVLSIEPSSVRVELE